MLRRIYFQPGNDRLVTTCVPARRLLEVFEVAFDQESAASEILQVSQLGIGWAASAEKKCRITHLRIGHPKSASSKVNLDQEVRVVTTQLQYELFQALNATNAECDQQLGSLMDTLSSNTRLLGVASTSGESGVFPLSGDSLSCPGALLALPTLLYD